MTDEEKLEKIKAIEEGIWGALRRGGLDSEWLYKNIASLESCQNIRKTVMNCDCSIGDECWKCKRP